MTEPTIIWPEGTKWWKVNGLFHREDGPAVIEPSGIMLFYLDGKLITDDPLVWFAMGRVNNS